MALGLEAAATAGEAVEIPKIVVTGEEETTRSEGTGSTSTIFPTRYEGRTVSVPEVLSEQAGIHITRYGGLEDATSVSIRGGGADEVTVLLDGIPLNSSERGGVDLSTFHLDDLEAIDIYRGMSPADLGGGPSAGTVSLRTKKIDRGPKGAPFGGRTLSGSLGTGSFDTISGRVSYSERRGRWGLLFGTSVRTTDGGFRFEDDNGTPANTADDTIATRRNNESQKINPMVKVSYEFDPKTRLESALLLFRTDRGVPGLGSNQSEVADLSLTEWIWSLHLTRRNFLADKLSLKTLSYVRATKSQYSDPNGEIGLGGAQDNDDDTIFVGQKVTINARFGPDHLLSSILFYQFERFRAENFLANPSTGSPSLRHRFDAALADEVEIFKRRVGLRGEIRLENVLNRINNDDPSFLNPLVVTNDQSHHEVAFQGGVTWRPLRTLSLNGNFSRDFRYPLFTELFGDQGGVVGNQALTPQETLGYDVGVVVHAGGDGRSIGPASFSLLYFDRHSDDLIQFQQNAGFARAENIGKARVWGIEAGGEADLWKFLSASAHYTYQRALDQGGNSGRLLPGVPGHELFGKLEGRVRRGKIFVSAQWIDSNYLDPLNTRVVRDRAIVNAGVSVKPLSWMTVSFEAKNVTDDRIVDVVGFPLPGRSFFGRVDVISRNAGR